MSKKIRVLELTGSFYDMGYQHGEAYREAIHKFTEERVKLSGDENWTGHNLSREQVIALGEACLEEHRTYSTELTEELQGMADATDLSLAELVIMNGFTDFIDVVYNVGALSPKAETIPQDNCTSFLVSNEFAQDNLGMFGQTWDMHDTATPYVILLKGNPIDAPAFLVFTITGCVGMIGMNDAGVAIGINNLMARDGQIGVTWPFVVRKALMQTNVDDALACITEAKLAGAHNYLLMDKTGKGYNVEAMSTHYHVEALDQNTIAHTNHCLIPRHLDIERKRLPESQANSELRLSRANDRLSQHPITPEMLMELTRDADVRQIPKPPMHIDTCGAAIMRPATGDFWAVWGQPSDNEYEHFTV